MRGFFWKIKIANFFTRNYDPRSGSLTVWDENQLDGYTAGALKFFVIETQILHPIFKKDTKYANQIACKSFYL